MTTISTPPAGIGTTQLPASVGPDFPIEPSTPQEPIGEYRSSAMGKVGVGAGSVVGALVGTALGGIFALAASTSGVGSGLSHAILGLGAIGGGVLGGMGVHSFNENRWKDAQITKRDTTVGHSTLDHARDYLRPFDHSGDGKIQLTNDTGIPSKDERIVTDTRTGSDSHLEYEFFDDEWETRRTYYDEQQLTSAGPMFKAADVDPTDGVVTETELARLMAEFDADRSGTLTRDEQTALTKAYPPIVSEWTRS